MGEKSTVGRESPGMAGCRLRALLFILLVGVTAGPARSDGNPDIPASVRERAEAIERKFLEHGLVDAGTLSPIIRVELKYSSPDNFMGEAVYGSLDRCWLRKEAAVKLARAAGILRSYHPEYRLCVLDAARPRSVQRRMYALVKGTPMQPYVANPAGVSMHNFGLAVDITIVDGDGVRLDMGTPPDFFGELAQPRLEEKFLREGRLTPAQVANRRLLRDVMTAAGFLPLSIEWWHFNALDRRELNGVYPIIE